MWRTYVMGPRRNNTAEVYAPDLTTAFKLAWGIFNFSESITCYGSWIGRNG